MPRPKQKVVRENYQLRLLPSERSLMEQKAREAGLKLSEYLRSAGINKTIRPGTKIPEINLATYVELGRIGNNINQLTKAAHKSLQRGMGCNISPDELSALLKLLKEIRLEVTAIDRQEDDDS